MGRAQVNCVRRVPRDVPRSGDAKSNQGIVVAEQLRNTPPRLEETAMFVR
jgi:hypothetical protein